MKKISILGMAALSFLWAGTTIAQEDEAPSIYTYATYMYCDTSKEDAADAGAAMDVPVMDKLVEDGVIAGWGWMAHHTGGQWRRIRYHNATSLQGAFDGLSAINEALTAEFGEDDNDDGASACPRHDDYVWLGENGGAGDDGRGDAGFSIYFLCDSTREERADEIVDEHLAPIYNKQVEDGALASWGWASHVIGGKYRRLLTTTAADHKSLLEARGAALEAIFGDDNELGAEFGDICSGHSDYMWNIVHETP